MAEAPSNALYNERILALSSALLADDRLSDPAGSTQVDSPLCGSRIRVDINLGPNGVVSEYGQQVRACALGRASAALMKKLAHGRSLPELQAGEEAVEALLQHGTSVPEGPWVEYAILEPARHHKSRHASILLPFKAIIKAVEHANGPKDR